jgi:hypothetical protein
VSAFDDLSKQHAEQEAAAEAELLGRFGPLLGTMRTIIGKSDLEAIRTAGVGFVLNIRPEQSMVHRANCEAVGVMSVEHPKFFSETAYEAAAWLMNDRDGAWEYCGRCRPAP